MPQKRSVTFQLFADICNRMHNDYQDVKYFTDVWMYGSEFQVYLIHNLTYTLLAFDHITSVGLVE